MRSLYCIYTHQQTHEHDPNCDEFLAKVTWKYARSPWILQHCRRAQRKHVRCTQGPEAYANLEAGQL